MSLRGWQTQGYLLRREHPEAWINALVRGAVGASLAWPFAVAAAYGWGAGWNAYLNLALTLYAFVLLLTLALTLRAAKRKPADGGSRLLIPEGER